MKISFTIKAAKEDEVLMAFCKAQGYQQQVRSEEGLIPNPESMQDFAQRYLREVFIAPYKQERAQLKVQAEVALVDSEV